MSGSEDRRPPMFTCVEFGDLCAGEVEFHLDNVGKAYPRCYYHAVKARLNEQELKNV